MKDLVIRELQEKDINSCVEIVPQVEPWISLGSSPEVMKPYFAKLLNRGEGFVAVLDGEIVGFASVKKEFLQGGYIRRIAVKERKRGQKIGQQLMNFIEEQVFRCYANIFVCVSSSNPRARKFYRNLGYRQVGKIPNLIQQGETEFLLRKEKISSAAKN